MRTRALLVVALLAALLGGCQQVDEVRGRAEELRVGAEGVLDRVRFCAAAVELAMGLTQQDAERAAAAAADMADAAPPELSDDVETVLAAAEVARSGDVSVLRDEQVRAAASRVAGAARARCEAPAQG